MEKIVGEIQSEEEEPREPDSTKKRKPPALPEPELKQPRKNDDIVEEDQTDDAAPKIGGDREQPGSEISPSLDSASADIGVEQDNETDGTPPIA